MAEKEKEEKGWLDLLDRIIGKESALSIDMDNVGIDLGEGRKIILSGKVNISFTTLK
jgi:hypothetical protein